MPSQEPFPVAAPGIISGRAKTCLTSLKTVSLAARHNCRISNVCTKLTPNTGKLLNCVLNIRLSAAIANTIRANEGPAVARYVARRSGRGQATTQRGRPPWLASTPPGLPLTPTRALLQPPRPPLLTHRPHPSRSLSLLCSASPPQALCFSSFVFVFGTLIHLAYLFGLATLSAADAVFTLLVPTETDLTVLLK